MSTRFLCDWCGAEFEDRAQVASADVTIGQQAEQLHLCVACAPDHLKQYFPQNDSLVTDGGEPQPVGSTTTEGRDVPYEGCRPQYAIGDATRRASEVVSQERDSHGDAAENHEQIAALWNAFLGDQLHEEIAGWQVAVMMQHVKQSRMQAGRLTKDHFVDVAGYADVALYTAVQNPSTEVDLDD